jgi:hypothetical protein
MGARPLERPSAVRSFSFDGVAEVPEEYLEKGGVFRNALLGGHKPLDLHVAVFKELHLPSLPRHGNENHERLVSVVFERVVEAIALKAGKERE